MHEYAVAEKILHAVLNKAKEENAKKIVKIEITANKLTHINEDEFKFSFNILSKNTIAENAEIVIKYSRGKILCKDCNKEYSVEHFLGRCPECSSSFVELVDEIVVSGIKIEK